MQEQGDRPHRKWTLVAAILGLSVTTLDQTVVFIAVPEIERELQIGLAGQQWVVNAYLLVLAAFILLGGSLADIFGRRRVFLLGALAFGAASLASGLAPTSNFLIASRAAQGLGAALLMPTTLALITQRYQGEDRAAAIGTWAAWSGVAAALGPLVGGALIEFVSWRAIFFLNIPVVLFAAAAGFWRVEESRREEASRRDLDFPGAALAALALGAFSYAAIQGKDIGWTAPTVLGAALLFAAALPAFLVWERRTRTPMLPLGLFRNRNFSAANGATLGLYGALSGSFFILMIHLQSVMGYSPWRAGLATLPMTVLFLLLSSPLGRLSERLGPRVPMTSGTALFGAGLLFLAFLKPGQSYWLHVLPGVIVLGLALPLAVPPLTNTAMSSAPEARAGTASGVNNVAARLAGLLAIALLGIVYAGGFRMALEPRQGISDEGRQLIERAREEPSAAPQPNAPQRVRQEVGPTVEAASQEAYRYAMLAGVLLALLGALVAWFGVRNPPDRASGRELPPTR